MSSEYTAVWVPLWASVGLFLASAVLAQVWGGPTIDTWDDDQETFAGEDAEDDMEAVRKWYRSRRVHDRLSYENIQDFLPAPRQPQQPHPLVQQQGAAQNVSFESISIMGGANDLTVKRSNSNPPILQSTLSHNELFVDPNSPQLPQGLCECQGLSEWDLHQQRHHARQSRSAHSFSTLLERRDSHASLTGSTPHPNSDYDFHPKNRNWRHFEHFSERDPRRNQQQYPSSPLPLQPVPTVSFPSLGPTPSSMPQLEPADTTTNTMTTDEHLIRIEDTHEERYDDDDDEEEEKKNVEANTNSISSSGSESSEEHFVWMKYSHRGRKPPQESVPPLPEKSKMWKVPSFLNLFTDPTEEASTTAKAKEEQDLAKPKQPSPDEVPTHRRNSMPTVVSIDRQEVELEERTTAYTYVRQRLFLSSWFKRNKVTEPIKLTNVARQTGTEQLKPARVVRQTSAPSRISTSNGIHHRQLRAQYNASIMPEKVILIRHGQSMGNINELLYSTTPDNAMPLTPLGWEQAREAGRILKDKILTSGQTVHFIVSPYVRTVETFHGMVSAWCDPKDFKHITDKEKRVKAWYRRLMEMGLTWNEDSRIREQDFGNYQDPETIRKAKQERHRFGVFYYRFPHGESASDVFDRVSTFLDSLWRSFEMGKSQNYVLVTHGISIRVLLARYFRYTIDQFNILANPRNCEMVVLGHNGEGGLELQGRCALEVGPTPSTDAVVGQSDGNETTEDATTMGVTGYQFYRRLRILPKNAIRKVKIRISPDD